MTVAEKIKEEREKRGLSLAQFGEALGTSRQAVCNWELGISKPSDDMRIKLHDVFGFPYAIFFEDEVN